MSHGQSGSLLVPLIFIICLIILPGPAGFFLAVFVLIVISAVMTERRRRQDSSPMPDLRVLRLPDPRPSAQDKADINIPAVNDTYGDDVFKTRPDRKREFLGYLGKQGTSGSGTPPFEGGDQPFRLRPEVETADRGPAPKHENGDEFSGLLQRSLLPWLAPVGLLVFLVALAESETLFYAFSYLFAAGVVTGVAALIVMLLGGWSGLSIGAAIVATYLTASVLLAHLPSAELVLAASAAWLVTCLLVRLLLKRKEKASSLLFLFAKNGTEFMVVFSAAAAIALLLPGLFAHVSLSRVLGWRENLESARAFLEKTQLNSGATLALVIALLIARNAFPNSKITSKLEPLWKGWDKGSDWLKRLGFVLTALFCFSFTGTLHGNVIDTLQSEIKEFDKIYDKLVWDVYLDLTAQLNIHAYSAAWDQLAPETKQIVQRELDLNQAADNVPVIYFEATPPASIDKELFFDDPQRELDNQKESIDFRRRNLLPDYPPDMPNSFSKFQAPPQATSQAVAEASSEAQRVRETRKTPQWMQGLGQESVNKFLDFVLDSDHLKYIRKITDQYPITSELLDVVSKSVQEKISNRLEKAAERIAAQRMENPSLKVADLIEKEVASLGIVVDSDQAASRIKAKEPGLQDRTKLVEAANKRFERDLVIERNKELLEMRTAENELKEVHRTVGSEIDIEPEGEFRDVNLNSLQIIKGRTLSYQDQLSGIVQRADGLKRAELLGILGAEKYGEIMAAPRKVQPDWNLGEKGNHNGLEVPHTDPPRQEYQEHPPAEVPHVEGPG
jgi:hypothetical protein